MGASSSKDVKVLVVGMDGSGKSTLLRHLRESHGTPGASSLASPLPDDAELDVATLPCFGKQLQLWKLGGRRGARPYWRHHYLGTRATIFMIDSTDSGVLGAVADEMRAFAADELVAGTVVLVLANKCDAAGAQSPAWLSSTLQLPLALKGHPWAIVPCSTLSGTGIDEGLRFLVSNL